MFPIAIGTAKPRISFKGLPWVISLTKKITPPFCPYQRQNKSQSKSESLNYTTCILEKSQLAGVQKNLRHFIELLGKISDACHQL